MSIGITFKASLYDGEDRNNPRQPFPAGRVYLSVQAEASDEQYAGAISGWVRPEVRSLVKAAPDLLAAAQAAWNCIGELPPTQARVEVGEMLTAAIARATGEV